MRNLTDTEQEIYDVLSALDKRQDGVIAYDQIYKAFPEMSPALLSYFLTKLEGKEFIRREKGIKVIK